MRPTVEQRCQVDLCLECAHGHHEYNLGTFEESDQESTFASVVPYHAVREAVDAAVCDATLPAIERSNRA